MLDMLEGIKQEYYNFYLANGRALESINNISRIELCPNEMRYGDDYLPFGYTRYCDGSILLQALPEFMDCAVELIKNSDEYIYKNIADYMKRKFNLVPNLERYKESSVWYGISDINNLNLAKKQSSTIKFDEKCGHEIIEKYVFIDRNSPGVFFGTLVGDNNEDKIVSVAKSIDGCKIAVGTHEDYRGRGYAVSNVAAMAEYILNNGMYAYYHTDGDNIGSQKTAQAAGLKEMSREKLFWFTNTGG